MTAVTVIAVTYNSADVLPDFLRGLKDAATAPIRLVVVDNLSTDDSVAVLADQAPEATVIRSTENAGFAAGINRAIDTVTPTGPVLILNPDVRLHAGAIDALLTVADRPDVGIVVPQLRDTNGTLLFSLRRDPHPVRVLGEAVLGGFRAGRLGLGELVSTPASYRQPRSADWATGACLLITADCRRRVGRWDESFFLYSEETDYAQRTRAAGLAVRYEPTALATHRGGEAHTSTALFTLLVLNRWRLYRRRHGALAGSMFRAALVIDMLPRALAGRRTARAALAGLLSPRTDPHRGSLPR